MCVLFYVININFLKEIFDKHDDSKYHIIDSTVVKHLHIPSKGDYSGTKRLIDDHFKTCLCQRK